MSALTEKLKLLPDAPGVYMMLDKDGIVIYVGKARVLKNRVRQYFHTSAENIASGALTVDADMGIFFRRINPLCAVGSDHRQRVKLHRLII